MSEQERIPLQGADYKRDPYPLYREMRERCPVHPVSFPSGVNGWLVTGYDVAHAALNDDRLGKDHSRGNEAWRAKAAIMPEPQHSQLQAHLLHQDPPRHTIMRRMVTDAFAPRRVNTMTERFQRIADDLVDRLPATGPVDLVDGFAGHFPFRVLAEVIGLAPELAAGFDRDWGKVVAPVGPTDPGRELYEARLHGLQSYIAKVAAAPGDGLLGELADSAREGVLTGEERDSMIFQLLVAGQEPVTNQICTALLTLLRRPEECARLRDEPALLDTAVDELLRFDSAFEMTTWRFLAEDDDLFGTKIPAGDSVIISLCAANRDPRKFPDADTLDLARSPNPHLAFGHGIHYCPGATLARIELRIAVATLLDRLPGLRLDGPDEQIEWLSAVLARGVHRLPVTYTERR